MDIPRLLQRLQTDNISGATALVELALDILEAFARQESTPEPHDFRATLQHLIGAVLAAQPSMSVARRPQRPHHQQPLLRRHTSGAAARHCQ